MKIHHLKTWPPYFEAVKSGVKTFELRKHDRKYAVGDTLALQEYDPMTRAYTGRSIYVDVTFMLQPGTFGLAPDYIAMSIQVRP